MIDYRQLLLEQLRRELLDPHVGHMMGGIWLVLHPIFLMAVYVFVFAFVFKGRMGGTDELPRDYTTYILSGLIPWLAIQQALGKSCSAFTQNAALIKQVVFPIEVLSAKAVLSAFVPLTLTLTVLIGYVLLSQGRVPWTYALLPLLMLALALWLLGIGFLLSATTVFVRDVRELVGMFLMIGIFLLPVVYVPEGMPTVFKLILFLNPLSYIIWCFQDVLYFGRFEHPWAWPVMFLGGVAAFAYGSRGLQALRPYFGDAL